MPKNKRSVGLSSGIAFEETACCISKDEEPTKAVRAIETRAVLIT